LPICGFKNIFKLDRFSIKNFKFQIVDIEFN
jgi:hypothetical protein